MSDLISILNDNSGAITAIATVVLVIITCIYAWSTHKTVKEMQNNRKIAFIRDQLESFYYPLFFSMVGGEYAKMTKTDATKILSK